MKKFIENISLKVGLTKTEINTLIFVFATFIIGLVARTIKKDHNVVSPKKFNYNTYDSLFNRVNQEYEKGLVSNKNNEKRVDSQAELYDFSTNKIDSKKNKSSELKLHSININTVNESVFIKLPGIGQKIARRIILLREKKGRFNRLDELIEVKGIGSKKLENIIKYLYIEK